MDLTEPWHHAHPPVDDLATFDPIAVGTLASITHASVGKVSDVRDDGMVQLDLGPVFSGDITYTVPYARLVYIRDPLGVLLRLTDRELGMWLNRQSDASWPSAVRSGRPSAVDAGRCAYFATCVMRYRGLL